MKLSRHYKPLLRFGLPMLFIWSLSWSLGVSLLAWIAVDLRDELRTNNLDNELTLYATVVYGLTWFDEEGQFHDRLLQLEPDMAEAPYDIWVVEAEAGKLPKLHRQPKSPRFRLNNFNELAQAVIPRQQDIFRDGRDSSGAEYRLYAMPTYSDKNPDGPAKAMIIVVANPVPGKAIYQAFVQRIILVTALLGLAGLFLGMMLTGLSLRPFLQSLRQRERFIAATAHELRTPLAALRSISDSAQQGDESAEKALQRMGGVLHKASNTVDDLLLFARLDAGAGLQCERLRLDLLVEAQLPEDGSITFSAEESIVNADPKLLTVAIRNLVDNAHKYGGKKSVAAEIHVTVSGNAITVSDQGAGFPSEIVAQTNRDFELSPSQGGTGLGLAIVKQIARLHGGKLSLSNIEPQGAQAIFHLKTSL